MGRVPDVKRLRKEDFEPEYQDMIERVAYSINTFSDQVRRVLNKNVDFINLNQELSTYSISIDSSGNLVNPSNIRHGLTSKPAGVLCVAALNLNDPTTFPVSQPFVSFSIINNTTISIQNITGLQNNSTYQLTLLIIGS